MSRLLPICPGRRSFGGSATHRYLGVSACVCVCVSEEGYYGNAALPCCREATWNYGRRSPKGIKKSRVTLEVLGRMLLFFFLKKEDVHFETVCLFDSRTVVKVGELNLQEVETLAGLFLEVCRQNKQKKETLRGFSRF